MPQASILKGLHSRRETQLTKPDSDPKLEEATLEGRITANNDPNKSKTTTKNYLVVHSVLRGQQQNTVFHKDNPWQKNQRAGRKLPKSQVLHQYNTAAETLANPHKNTSATTVSLMSAHVQYPV